MKKISKVISTVLCLIISLNSFGQLSDTFWITKDLNWEQPNTGHPEIDSTIYGNVASIYFAPNGQYRLRRGYGSITELDSIYHWAESYIYGGTWKLIDSTTIEIEYNLISWIIKPTELRPNKFIYIHLESNEITLMSEKFIKSNMLVYRDKRILTQRIIRPKLNGNK